MTKVIVGLLVVVGGCLVGRQLNAQTWLPDGPGPRLAHSAVFNSGKKVMLVFGGVIPADNATPRSNLNDVWRLNASLAWTAVSPVGDPPAPRALHTAVMDAANDRMIIFGGGLGNSSPCVNDVWVLTNGSGGKNLIPEWTELSPIGTAPGPRHRHGAVYDPVSNSMIVVGGNNCFSGFYHDVWVLSHANGLGGAPAWTQLFPIGGGPTANTVNGGVALDSAHNKLMVFGGSPANNDVWVLSNANGQGGTPEWTKINPTGPLPAVRSENSTLYDAKTNRLMIFGGSDDNSVIRQDTWVLTNANGLGGPSVWSKLGPFALFPTGRFSHTAVYNAKRNTAIIFGGGAFYDGIHTMVANDVWVLDHANGQ